MMLLSVIEEHVTIDHKKMTLTHIEIEINAYGTSNLREYYEATT